MSNELQSESPKLYKELAAYWPVFSGAAEYAEESAFYVEQLQRATTRPLRHVLELGSGGGNNASHMKAHFNMTLVDPAPGMLAASKALNPDCEHVQGDMRTVRLDREFDAVFVHDAVCYMTTERDLRSAIETAFLHCAPGGAALFAPDHTRENFLPSSSHGGEDGEDVSVRYLEWTIDPDPLDTTYIVDYAIMIRGRDGSVRLEHDRHIEGLFSRADWLGWLSDAGFEGELVPCELSDVEPKSYEVFIARKPR
ncbi:MAG TPA: class I SAM-dependent methyltransferase [Gemmatimonadaceae bacterium]|nr:class I SAM-dependent methyltransferase [Gemmatimonadaceae bacterium]